MKLFESQKIDEWHRKLNSKIHAPKGCYRRNVRIYNLVCYVNNIIGCYLSHHEEAIMAFIRRSRKHMNDFPENEELHEYYKMVKEYLDVVESHLKKNGVDTNPIYGFKKNITKQINSDK